MYVTPLQDSTGTAITTPTPIKLLDLQEGSLDFSGEPKMLYGQNSFPVAVGIGKRAVGVKVKPARVLANGWNTLFFGQTLNSGLVAMSTGGTASAIPATPFAVTVTPPSSGVYAQDLGVIDWNGSPMKRVASAPATGQYSVVTATGVYTFAAADTLKNVYISYQYTATVTGAQKQTVVNQPMGYAPTFRADLQVSYLGKFLTISLPQCMASKMSLGLKNEDFAVPEFEFSAFDNGAGQILTWSTSE